MKSILFLFVSFLYLQFDSFSQAPDTMWTKTYVSDYSDVGESVQQTNDGGYILTGYNDLGFNYEVYLIKTNELGGVTWSKTFGGWNSEGGKAVLQTEDGGYIVLAYTATFGGGLMNTWLIRTDEFGDTLWTKIYGSGSSNICYSIKQTTDGGYIIAGTKDSLLNGNNVWLIKTNQDGIIQWTKTYGYNTEDYGRSVQQTTDGGYIIAGCAEPSIYTGFDAYIIKTNEFGDTIWTKTYGGNLDETANSILQTTDGGYILVGSTDSPTTMSQSDIWVLRLNQNGDTLWTKMYGGNNPDFGNSIILSEDGNYIVVGSIDNDSDIYLLKINDQGDTLWTKTFGDLYSAQGKSVQETTDHGYIIVGSKYDLYTSSDVWLIKTAPITLLEPNGGGIWYMGGEQTISWKSEYIEHIKIQLSNDGGLNWSTIVESTPNNGTYTFLLSPQTPSTECLLRISDAQDSSIFDMSDSVFAIAAISVISPNGGEYFIIGDTINISWFSEYVTNVSIKLSLNNGLSWNAIVDSTSNNGIYSWIVDASDSSKQCLIQISDLLDSSIYDASDDVFTIDLLSLIEDEIEYEYVNKFVLVQNFPNPFNPTTKISWQVPVGSWQSLKIYDVLANEVATLVDEYKSAGKYEVEFNSSSGIRNLASGIYFYQLRAVDPSKSSGQVYVETKKMILLK